MNLGNAAEALMRRRLLEGIYDRMTDDEKKLFIQMTLQQQSTDRILEAMQRQSAQTEDLRRRQQTFAEDFASNVLGNAAWAGAEWLMARLARLIR